MRQLEQAGGSIAPLTESGAYTTAVAIGGLAIEIRCGDPRFIRMLEKRYAGFVSEPAAGTELRFDVEVVPPSTIDEREDLEVRYASGCWIMKRGDFFARWNPVSRHGDVRQGAFPYGIDSVMRIVHSLVLAPLGGFLVHSASAVRNGRAFLFSGISGAGKTTISRLAPPDVTLLSDEISYVRRLGDRYQAFGTPFAGELAQSGENVDAPLVALHFLAKGQENRTRQLTASSAASRLLRNILFFADNPALVKDLFRSACDFVSRVPVYELTFRPDREVWDLIR